VNWKYLGCYKDAENDKDRDFTRKIADDTDPRKCFAMAARQGYKYAGL